MVHPHENAENHYCDKEVEEKRHLDDERKASGHDEARDGHPVFQREEADCLGDDVGTQYHQQKGHQDHRHREAEGRSR